jgi:hypothetical protein
MYAVIVLYSTTCCPMDAEKVFMSLHGEESRISSCGMHALR